MRANENWLKTRPNNFRVASTWKHYLVKDEFKLSLWTNQCPPKVNHLISDLRWKFERKRTRTDWEIDLQSFRYSYKNKKNNEWVSKAKLTSTTIFLARAPCNTTRSQKRLISCYKYYHNIKTSQLWAHLTYTHTASPDMPNAISGMSGHAKNQSLKNFEFCVKIHFLCLSFIILHPVPGSCFLFIIPCFCSTLNRF